MRVLALLLLLFGPLLSAPAAAGLWTWAWIGAAPYGLAYAAGAGAAAALLVALAVRRPGLVRQVAVLVLSLFWAGWLWLEMTSKAADWRRPPELQAPDGFGRMVLILLVLVYLTLYALAEQGRPRRLS